MKMFKQGMRTSFNFASGTAIGCFVALQMHDMVYNQFKKHVMTPIDMVNEKDKASFEDLKGVGSGTSGFVKQFKPHALAKYNAKMLMIDDGDFSTPGDHYFNYLNKRSGQSKQERDDHTKSVYVDMRDKLDTKDDLLDDFSPFVPKQVPEYLAFSSQTGIPRHSKEEYKSLHKVQPGDIFKQAVGGNEQKKYTEKSGKSKFQDMLKIQKKKKQVQSKKLQEKFKLQQKETALQRKVEFEQSIEDRAQRIDKLAMSKAPGSDVTEEALQLYDEQNLDSVKPSDRDISRLEDLKAKALKPATRVVINRPGQTDVVNNIEEKLQAAIVSGAFVPPTKKELDELNKMAIKTESDQVKATSGADGGKFTINDALNQPHREIISRVMENDVADFPTDSRD